MSYSFNCTIIGCITALVKPNPEKSEKRVSQYLPREAQEVCLDCAAEPTMDAPSPSTVTSSTPLNSLICSAMHTIRTSKRPLFLFAKDFQRLHKARAMRWVLILAQLGQESLVPRPTCDTCLTSVGYPISISCSLCTAARPGHRD